MSEEPWDQLRIVVMTRTVVVCFAVGPSCCLGWLHPSWALSHRRSRWLLPGFWPTDLLEVIFLGTCSCHFCLWHLKLDNSNVRLRLATEANGERDNLLLVWYTSPRAWCWAARCSRWGLCRHLCGRGLLSHKSTAMLFLQLQIEWFGIYPQVKQAPCLCSCVVLAVIAKVMGLGFPFLNGKERNLPVSSANPFMHKLLRTECISQMKACFICK